MLGGARTPVNRAGPCRSPTQAGQRLAGLAPRNLSNSFLDPRPSDPPRCTTPDARARCRKTHTMNTRRCHRVPAGMVWAGPRHDHVRGLPFVCGYATRKLISVVRGTDLPILCPCFCLRPTVGRRGPSIGPPIRVLFALPMSTSGDVYRRDRRHSTRERASVLAIKATETSSGPAELGDLLLRTGMLLVTRANVLGEV